jgi:acyl carrier protein
VGTPATENSDVTVARLVTILADRLEGPIDASVGEDTPLSEEGLGLDSLMVVEFALDIEEEFGVELNEEEMLEMAGMTLREVTDFVSSRVVGAAAS